MRHMGLLDRAAAAGLCPGGWNKNPPHPGPGNPHGDMVFRQCARNVKTMAVMALRVPIRQVGVTSTPIQLRSGPTGPSPVDADVITQAA